jgi:hypothetical protein
MDGGLFMAHKDVTDLVLLEKLVVDVQDGATGIAEKIIDLFFLEAPDYNFRTGNGIDFGVGRHVRTAFAVAALVIGATGTYYWNAYSQAQEYEEIDSALLADELPPSAYLDKGFHAWLERGSDSSSE